MSVQLIVALVSIPLLIVLAPQILSLILHFLPNSEGLPAPINDTLTFAVEKLAAVSFIFPSDSLVTALVFIVVFEIAVLTFRLVMRIIKLIRGTN